LDNLPNRILRSALAVARRTVGQYAQACSTEIGMARRCEAAMAEVQTIHVQRGDFARVSAVVSGPLKHYGPIVQLATMIILLLDPFIFEALEFERLPALDIFQIGSSSDGTVKWDLVDMPKLFQEYVRVITEGEVEDRTHFRIHLKGSDKVGLKSSKDLYLDRAPITLQSKRFVFDTKYKVIGTIADERVPRIERNPLTLHLSEHQIYPLVGAHGDEATKQISSQDIYQIVAYATHDRIRGSYAGLVYPTVSPTDTSASSYYVGLGFSSEGEKHSAGIPVHILTTRIDEAGILLEAANKTLLHRINTIAAIAHIKERY